MRMMYRRVLVFCLILCLLSVFYISPVKAATTHPFLFFSQQDLVTLKGLTGSPSHQSSWNAINSWANVHTNDPAPGEPVDSEILFRTDLWPNGGWLPFF